MFAHRTRAAWTCAACVVVVGCVAGAYRATLMHTPRSMNLLIVTLDTTRADRLSVYGFMDATMPALERLAREGVVFDQATTVAPLTLPAHCSLFTGLLPPRHGVRDNADPALSPQATTLAETLQARGYRTGAFVGSVVLDAGRGLAQGFDVYHGVEPGLSHGQRLTARQRPAGAVVTDAVQWIDTVGDAPFFAWVHLYDPHRPYDPPEPFRSRYADGYTAELAYVDAEIGRLVAALERRGSIADTVIVVVGDHGESLGDHGERDHGIFVYESVLRVPLIVRAPRIGAARVPDVVRLVDVMPTVVDLLGMPNASTDGSSLAGLMRGGTERVEREAYAESRYPARFGWSPVRALRAGRYKVIDAPKPELYDLDRDPFEERNLYATRPELARVMIRAVEHFDRTDDDTTSGDAPDPQLVQRLAALGYVGATVDARSAESDRPDPKDCVGMLAGRRVDNRCGKPGALLMGGGSAR